MGQGQSQGGVLLQGRLVKAKGGFYFVQDSQGEILACRARGRFKEAGVDLLVGDFVAVDRDKKVIEKVHARKNSLLRPAVANVDQVVIVMSVMKPPLDLFFLDRILVSAEAALLDIIICLNKMDLMAARGDGETAQSLKDGETAQAIKDGETVQAPKDGETAQALKDGETAQALKDGETAQALKDGETVQALKDGETVQAIKKVFTDCGYRMLFSSAVQGYGIEELRNMLQGKTTVLSGPSGAGKSTLVNKLIPELKLPSQAVSTKTERGRHTTRHVELLELGNATYVADTPGFQKLDFRGISAAALRFYFPEIAAQNPCQFNSCLHHTEPGCQVKDAVQKGAIAPWRYAHYLAFLTEIQQKEKQYPRKG